MLRPIIHSNGGKELNVGRAGTAEVLDEMKGVGPELLEHEGRAGGLKMFGSDETLRTSLRSRRSTGGRVRRQRPDGGLCTGRRMLLSCQSRRKEDEQRGDLGFHYEFR